MKPDDHPWTALADYIVQEGQVSRDDCIDLDLTCLVSHRVLVRLWAHDRRFREREFNRTMPGASLSHRKSEARRSSRFLAAFGSTPLGYVGPYRLGDSVALLWPRSSVDAFGELASSLHLEYRSRESKRVRGQAAGSTYYHWVLSHIEDPSAPHGHLAEDFRDAAGEFPMNADTYWSVHDAMERIGMSQAACEAHKATWIDYARQYPERIRPAPRCHECHADITPDDAMLVISDEDRHAFIACRKCSSILVDRESREAAEHEQDVADDEVFGIPGRNRLPALETLNLAQAYPADIERFLDLSADRPSGDYIVPADIWEHLQLIGMVPPEKGGHVYFISGQEGRIKIGYTGGAPQERLRDLQTGHAGRLLLLGCIPGSRQLEKDIHAQLRDYRVQGEWFLPHPDVIDYIRMACPVAVINL